MGLSIYKSSAGSGKTYTLAKEYLKLLINNPNGHPYILAVTFTNKATQEMKERILVFLQDLSTNKNPQLAQQLITEMREEGLGTYTHQFIQTHSLKALREIIHNYSQFTILTIDSFFNRIIKAFAHEMKLPLRMDLQLNQNQALEEAYNRLMMYLNDEPQVQEWLTQFMFNKLDKDKGWYIEREVKELGKELFKETYQEYEKELRTITLDDMNLLVTELLKIKISVEDQLKSLGEIGLHKMKQNNLDIPDFAFGKSGVAQYFIKLAELDKSLFEPGKRTLEAAQDAEKWFTKKAPNRTQNIHIVNSDLLPLINQALDYVNDNTLNYFSAIGVLNNIYALGLLNHLQEMLRLYRDEEDTILISDQNKLISEIIARSEVPFIYEKTGTRFNHYLIDEFQDTSAIQWRNFLPLLQNALAQNNKVLLVGDAKQSIYRWRGGQMQLLLQQVANDLMTFSKPETFKNLQENYRSTTHIIHFNNQFFKNIHTQIPEIHQLSELAYSDVSQKATPFTKDGGYIKYKIFEADNDTSFQNFPIEAEEEDNDDLANDAYEKVNKYMIDKIQSWVKSKANQQYSDIAILVETNAQGSSVAEALNQAEIPVQSSDSLLLINAASIQFLIACLELKQTPDDPLLKAAFVLNLIYYQLVDKDRDSWLKRAKNKDGAFYDSLPTAWKKFFFGNPQETLLGMCHSLIKLANLETKEPAYIQRFCEVIMEYELKNETTLLGFLNWWKEASSQQSIQVPAHNNAVIISTIHRAKGLQFPVVFLPYLNRSVSPKHNQILWVNSSEKPYNSFAALPINYSAAKNTYFEKARDEETAMALVDVLNMIYVAFTRAEQALYILPIVSKGPQKTSTLIKHILTENEGFNFGKNQEEWHFGDEKSLPINRKENSHFQTINSYYLPQNKAEIILRKNNYKIDDLALTNREAAQLSGNIMHELLAEINSEEEIAPTIHQAVINGLIREDSVLEWTKSITQILNIITYKNLLESALEIYSEREIIYNNEVLRPDKVIITKEAAHVIDFKTGTPSKQANLQILEYKTILAKIGYAQVEAYLFYTNHQTLEKI